MRLPWRVTLFSCGLPLLASAQWVKVAPYYTAGVGTQSLTTTATTDTSMDVLASGSMVRTLMPRSEYVYQIAIYLGDTTALTGLYFSTNTCATASSNNCLTFTPSYTARITGPFTPNTVNTFTLAAPLFVNKWDALGVRAEWSTPHSANLALLSSQLFPVVTGNGASTLAEACYDQLNVSPKPATFTLSTMTLVPNAGCPVVAAYMTPPTAVGVGDSIMCGAPAPSDCVSDAFAESYSPSTPSTFSPLHFWMGGYTVGGFTYQGMGWSGETAVEEDARFAADILPLKPRMTLIDGGVNDLLGCSAGSGCTGPQITAIENAITDMLSQSQANGIKAYVMLIGCWGTPNGTNARHMSADAINANTIAVASSYGATVIDWRSTICQFRSGGTAGNLWDFQPSLVYGDGLVIHPNQTGMANIGSLISVSAPLGTIMGSSGSSSGSRGSSGGVF